MYTIDCDELGRLSRQSLSILNVVAKSRPRRIRPTAGYCHPEHMYTKDQLRFVLEMEL